MFRQRLAAGGVWRPFRGLWRMPGRFVKNVAAAGGFRLTCADGLGKREGRAETSPVKVL